MEQQPWPALIAVLEQRPDPRQRRGIRHPLAALLALSCAAILCGAKSYGAGAEWGRNYDPAFLRALGFTQEQAPCGATFFQTFRKLDRQAAERRLGAWAEAGPAALPPQLGEAAALALDGKTRRGSKRQGALGVHLLSVVSHRLGLTVAQAAVDDKTNEIPLAAQMVDGGGGYVMVVKGNQPTLAADIATVFSSPPPPASGGTTPSSGSSGRGGRSGGN